MNRKKYCRLLILLACLAGIAGAPSFAEEIRPEVEVDAEVSLPRTYPRIWYRTPTKRFPLTGDLTISEDGLDLLVPKNPVHIPLDRIQILSYGKLKGDVNTDWVLIGVGETQPIEIIAFRDAQKLGYGQRTREIFDGLRSALRQLGAGQYRVPEGLRPYDKIDAQVALGIPEDWDVFFESLVYVGERAPWGMILFSSEQIQHVEIADEGRMRLKQNPGVLERVLTGRTEAFFIERIEASKGMSCDGFTAKAAKRVLKHVARDPLFGEDYEVLEPVSSTPTSVGRCRGLRITGRSRTPEGQEVRLDLLATAHRDTLFMFGLRALDENYDTFRESFDAAIATVKFAVGRLR